MRWTALSMEEMDELVCRPVGIKACAVWMFTLLSHRSEARQRSLANLPPSVVGGPWGEVMHPRFMPLIRRDRVACQGVGQLGSCASNTIQDPNSA